MRRRVAPATLEARATARVLDEDSLHRLRRCVEEVSFIEFPIGAGLSLKPKIWLVYQFGRAERMRRPPVSHLLLRHRAKLVVDLLEELLELRAHLQRTEGLPWSIGVF